MNATTFPCRVNCPHCSRAIQAETADLMGSDYWQHLAKEHGEYRPVEITHEPEGLVWGHSGVLGHFRVGVNRGFC